MNEQYELHLMFTSIKKYIYCGYFPNFRQIAQLLQSGVQYNYFVLYPHFK